MQIYQRVSVLVQAWRVPEVGQIAEEAAPTWLVERLQSGEIAINGFGGLTHQVPHGSYCLPGDYVVLSDDDRLEFCPRADFASRFEPLARQQAA